MKKLCACLWGVGLMASAAQAAMPVVSCNSVGFANMPVGSSNEYTCVAVNFTSSHGGLTLSELFGDQLKASNDSHKAGKVMLWDVGAQHYVAYGLKEDGRFYPIAKWVGGLPHSAPVTAGSVLWVQGGAGSLTVLGVINDADAVTNSLAGGPDHPMNLICYPYPVAVAVQDFINTSHGALANDDLEKADRLSAWDSVTRSYVCLGLKGDGKWHKTIGWKTNAPYQGIIRIGEGVFFQGGREITWVVRRPYERFADHSSSISAPAAGIVCGEGSGMLCPSTRVAGK